MMITKIAITLFLINLALFGGPNAEAEEFIKLGDIKGEATDNDHKDWIKLGDIKGEATDKDHKDWVFVQVMMYCDLVDMGFTAEQADQIVELTLN